MDASGDGGAAREPRVDGGVNADSGGLTVALARSEIDLRSRDHDVGVHWKLFADLRERAGAETVAVGDADTVGEALDDLLAERDVLRERVLDADGAVVPDVNVLKNGTNVANAGDGLDEPVSEGDELALLPPVSGG